MKVVVQGNKLYKLNKSKYYCIPRFKVLKVVVQGNKLNKLNKLKILLPSSILNLKSFRTKEQIVQTEQTLNTIAYLDLK